MTPTYCTRRRGLAVCVVLLVRRTTRTPCPETRRDNANLLSRVAQNNGPLKQVVVTTYEDQLAQRLHDRYPDNIHLATYVKTDRR